MKVKTVMLGSLLAMSCMYAQADDKTITINSSASYYDVKIIPTNIRSECTTLGTSFSNSTKENLVRNGWQVVTTEDVSALNEGVQLKLEIVNASSSGNAFMGHHKSVSINAELYKDGKLVDTYAGTRDSGGGFGAGFKGSCAVLQRCTVTLGKDVAKWLNTKNI